MKKRMCLAVFLPVLICMLGGCGLIDSFKSEPVVIKHETPVIEPEEEKPVEIGEEEQVQPEIETPVVEEEKEEVTPEPTPVQPSVSKSDMYYARAVEIQGYEDEISQKVSDQATMNNDSHIVFQMWDGLLNEIYQHLKTTMSQSEFKALESDELDWIVEKEAAMEQVRNEYEGGSMAPLMVNSTATQYTKERCYYLISLVED